jgi:hypothetical protein
MNESWVKWIIASICKHFESVTMHVEGRLRNTSTLGRVVELRYDGPDFIEQDNVYCVNLIINILIQEPINPSDAYALEQIIGQIVVLFTNIDIYKYGYDDSLLGCLELIQDDGVTVKRFGQADPKINKLQTTIEGHYSMDLEDS